MNKQSRSRRRGDGSILIHEFNQRLTAWVFGTGLLVFHAGVFLLTMTGLIFWNAYDQPSNFWVADLLKRWGAVLTLHAVVTLALTVGWRLLGAADIQEASEEHWTPTPAQRIRTAVTEGNWRMLEPGHHPNHAPFVPSTETDPPGPSAVRRFRARAAERVSIVRGKRGDVAPEVAASWPEPPNRREPDDDELIRRFGPGDSYQTDARSPSNPRARARWSWVEAAATSWALRRESSEGDGPERKPRAASPAPPTAETRTPSPDDDPRMPL